jgi:transmembrane sensor
MQKEAFEKLFEGYIQNTLSESEFSQLMQMIKNDEHDAVIKYKIDVLLDQNEASDTLDQHTSDTILGNILSRPLDLTVLIDLQEKKKNRKKILPYAFAAALTILTALGSFFFYHTQPLPVQSSVEQTTAPEKDILVFNGKQVIHLPEGSTIILNEKSSITYDQNDFNQKTREVSLSGEAYFDIKKNTAKPFIVHTGKVSTKVLGTAFNINAYGGSDKIKVTVERGKVQVGDDQKIYALITPNQEIVVDKNTLQFEQHQIKAQTATAWKSSYLILDNLNMEQAASTISQKYKVQIILSNENIKKCTITASFLNDEDLDHVLKVICSVIGTRYHYAQNGSIVLEGEGCE